MLNIVFSLSLEYKLLNFAIVTSYYDNNYLLLLLKGRIDIILTVTILRGCIIPAYAVTIISSITIVDIIAAIIDAFPFLV